MDIKEVDEAVTQAFASVCWYYGLYHFFADLITECEDKVDKSGRVTIAGSIFEEMMNSFGVELIWCFCVLMFGNYGVSPRCGWIEDWESCKKFLHDIVDESLQAERDG